MNNLDLVRQLCEVDLHFHVDFGAINDLAGSVITKCNPEAILRLDRILDIWLRGECNSWTSLTTKTDDIVV